MASPTQSLSSERDPLDLESLDADSIFAALTAIERSIPTLLQSVKPILRHLSGGTGVGGGGTGDGKSEEIIGEEARDGVDQYLNTLDKIQYILRQTVYYLRETKASPSTLRRPPPNAIPTPFASSLPSQNSDTGDDKAQLGLYASRLESRTLANMLTSLMALRREMENRQQADKRAGDGEDMTIDPKPTDTAVS